MVGSHKSGLSNGLRITGRKGLKKGLSDFRELKNVNKAYKSSSLISEVKML